MTTKITTVFVDVGGVLATNGWDHNSRALAAEKFHLNADEFNARHQMMNDLLEIGKCTLDEYLNTVVFYEKRAFTLADFKEFMIHESRSFPEMIDFVTGLKKEFGLNIIVVSNECRELTEYRIEKFKLKNFVSSFVSSCFIGMRKPDPAMYQLALDLSGSKPQEVIYLDDRELYVTKANQLGIHGIHHVDLETTKIKVLSFLWD